MLRFVLRLCAGLIGLLLLPTVLALAFGKSWLACAVAAILAVVFLRYALIRGRKRTARNVGSRSTGQFDSLDITAATDNPRKPRKRSRAASLVDNIWPAKHGFVCDVVGESHYQDALTAAVGHPPTRWNEAQVMASLVCETDNKHDSMAVAVFVNGNKVGYLRADAARAFHERLKRRGIPGQTTHCGALIRGGGTASDGTQRLYGILLNIQSFG
jgi:hypothetical protein